LGPGWQTEDQKKADAKAKRDSLAPATHARSARRACARTGRYGRIKPSVKAMVERLADADGRSLANYVERLIEAAEEAAQKGKKS
jgi:predicted HicB family RNase H-like nuclease